MSQQQIEWTERGLAIAEAATEPRARRWVGTLRHNLGWTLHDMDRHADALEQWEAALRARLEEGDAEHIRIARWTVARGLRSLGRVEEALAIQWELAANGPEDGYVHEELAELLRAQDNAEEAEYTRPGPRSCSARADQSTEESRSASGAGGPGLRRARKSLPSPAPGLID